MTNPLTDDDAAALERAATGDVDDFRPTGTIFILVLFVAAMILLWASVYVILLSRGVTV